MKKVIAILSLLFSTLLAFSQVVIKMEEDGGVYKIPCVVNGTKIKFVFDTGASAVCLSESMAEYLYDNDYIAAEDFVGRGQSSVADGRIVNNLHLILRDIEIAGLHLRDVESIVIEGQKAPLLLGMTAISKLGRIELNGNQLIIHSAKGVDDVNAHVDDLLSKAVDYYYDNLFSRAKDCFAEVDGYGRLNDYSRYLYASSCMMTKDYKAAKRLVDQISDNDNYRYFSDLGINFYSFLGWVHMLNDFYSEALVFYKKAYESKYPHEDSRQKASYCSSIGTALALLDRHDEAATYFYLACDMYAKNEGIDLDYVQRDALNKLRRGEKPFRQIVKNADDIDYNYYYYLVSMYYANRCGREDHIYQMCMLAENGNPYAIKRCKDLGVDSYSYLRRYGY